MLVEHSLCLCVGDACFLRGSRGVTVAVFCGGAPCAWVLLGTVGLCVLDRNMCALGHVFRILDVLTPPELRLSRACGMPCCRPPDSDAFVMVCEAAVRGISSSPGLKRGVLSPGRQL